MIKIQTIIIGAGPGGSAAALYLARFGHEVALLDASKTIRGRTSWGHSMQNIPGFSEEITGDTYLNQVYEQLKKFGVSRQEEFVTRVTSTKSGHFEVISDKNNYLADYVVVAVGVQDILPQILGVEEYYGRSLFTCPTCNWFQTKDKITAIVTNGDKGLTTGRMFQALQENSVKWIIPSSSEVKFSDELREKTEKEGVHIVDSPLTAIRGSDGKISKIELADSTVLEVDILYARMGIKRLDTFLKEEDVSIKRDDTGCMIVDFKTHETNIKNLFAVGPCNSGEDQVVIAAGEGAVAATEIHSRIITRKGI